MEDKNFIKGINKIVILLSWIGALGASGGLLFDYINKTRSLLEFIIIFIVTFGSAISSTAVYKRNFSSKLIRTLCMWSFIFYYGFLYITYPSFLPFVFIFPILTLETLYASKKALLIDSIIVIIINVVGTLIKLNGQVIDTQIKSQLIMQFGVIFAFLLVITVVVSIYEGANKRVSASIKRVKEAQQTQENMLDDILKLIEVSGKNSKAVYQIVEETSNSSEYIISNISEVGKAMNVATDRIENEFSLIENIQYKIKNILELSNEMETAFKDMNDDVYNSSNNSEELNKKSKTIKENYNKVCEEIMILKEKTNEIQEIAVIITNLVDQTNLLSINAAIEALSAGEHGKGFMVVANEIRALANESKMAANRIFLIIEDIVMRVEKSTLAIENLKNLNNEEDLLITKNKEALVSINYSVEMVKRKINVVNQQINYTIQAIESINKSISDTKDSSEKIMRQFDETLDISQKHRESSEKAIDLVRELMNTTKDMEKYLN